MQNVLVSFYAIVSQEIIPSSHLFHIVRMIGPQQKVGIRVGRSEKVDFYKGTFRAQTGTIVHTRNFLVLFRPNE